MVVSIENADYKGDYVFGLRFSDGVERDIDLGIFNYLTHRNKFRTILSQFRMIHWRYYFIILNQGNYLTSI